MKEAIGNPCQELPVEISIALLGSTVFPEQCIILCPKYAIWGFKGLFRHVRQVSTVT